MDEDESGKTERGHEIIITKVDAALTELHKVHQVEELRMTWECQLPWKGAARRNAIGIHLNIANPLSMLLDKVSEIIPDRAVYRAVNRYYSCSNFRKIYLLNLPL